jgi:predicted  nucleic acid-binding Zn-ribbon protein
MTCKHQQKPEEVEMNIKCKLLSPKSGELITNVPKPFLRVLLACTSLTYAGQALAAPTLYPRNVDALRQVINTTNATLLGDTENPYMVYVLPPKAGTATASQSQFRSANIGFCQEMANLQTFSRELAAVINRKALQLQDREPELQAAQHRAQTLREQAEQMVASSRDLQTVISISDRLQTIESRLDSLYDRLNRCTDSTPECELITTEARNLEREKTDLNAEARVLRTKVRTELAQYNRARQAAQAAREAYDEALAPYNRILQGLEQARSTLFSSYSQFGKLEGGYASITYDSGWDQSMQTLRAANPGIRFEMIDTRNAQLRVGLTGASSREEYLASLPAILDYTVNGRTYLPYGTATANDTLPSFPSRLSGGMRLSLVGACPLVNPEIYGVKRDQQGLPVFTIGSTYEYPSTFRTRVSFQFNMYKVYEQIRDSGTSGGLFWTRSWNHVTENRLGRESMNVRWEEEDPSNQVTLEEKQRIEREIKNELMARALRQFATPMVDSHPELLAAPAVPTSGAIVLANGLSSTCGWYSIYCSAGAWLIRGLQSIFGGSESESTYRSRMDITETETWSTDQARYRAASTSFTTE